MRITKRKEAVRGCVCATCTIRRDMDSVRAVDTDAYHGTGAVESLQFKVGYLQSAIERLVDELRCERDETEDGT